MIKQEGYGCCFTGSELDAYSTALDEIESYLKSMLYRFCGPRTISFMESSRIKKMESIIDKIFFKKKKNENVDIKNEIRDIAGIRIVFCDRNDACDLNELDKQIHSWDKDTFKKNMSLACNSDDNCDIKSVYEFLDFLKQDNSYEIIEEKDYIKEPKPSGYQSFHIIIKASNGCLVEIQIRNFIQHLFAEFEHDVVYKADEDVKDEYRSFCQECSNFMKMFSTNISGPSKVLKM